VLVRATPVSPAVVLVDQSGEEQESLALPIVGTVDTPQRTRPM
jgi:hypothetical protein